MLCMAYKIDDGDTRLLTDPAHIKSAEHIELLDYLADKGLVAAWNAGFDRLIWNAVMPPEVSLPLERWYCLSAQARVNAMPASLGDCTRALTGRNQKDFRGGQLIRLLSLPQKDGSFNNDPTLMQEMYEYCIQDVEASYLAMNQMRLMTQAEHEHWLDTECVNDRGVRVDVELAEYAAQYAGQETLALAKELSDLTEGYITKHTQVARIRDFVFPKLDAKALKLTEIVQRKGGETKQSLDKAVRARLLDAYDTKAIDLPPDVLGVLEILDEGNKSSVAKFQKMIDLADEYDERVRGAFVYCGASQTNRFASRGLQLHNFGRDCLKEEETDDLVWAMARGEDIADPMHTLAKALRPAITAEPGNLLVVGDWSQIEARALPWLAGATDRLAMFREIDADPDAPDIYTRTAEALGLGERQIGKVAELACGYGGAVGAFKTMAQIYRVTLDETTIKRVVDKWRASNQWAVEFWNALEKAARSAISTGNGSLIPGTDIGYSYHRDLMGGSLLCWLPGGTTLTYPAAKLEQDAHGRRSITALKANWKPAAGEKDWPRVSLWRGLLAENVTQAICAALLREAVSTLHAEGLKVIAHVHDEIILEVPAEKAKAAARRLQRVMEKPPSWARNLPLKAEPQIHRRYGK